MKSVPVFVWPIAGGVIVLATMSDQLDDTARLIVVLTITISIIWWAVSVISKFQKKAEEKEKEDGNIGRLKWDDFVQYVSMWGVGFYYMLRATKDNHENMSIILNEYPFAIFAVGAALI